MSTKIEYYVHLMNKPLNKGYMKDIGYNKRNNTVFKSWEAVHKYISGFNIPLSVLSSLPILDGSDGITKGKLASKAWLTCICDTLRVLEDKDVCVCNSSDGLIPAMLFGNTSVLSIHGIDKDTKAGVVSSHVNATQFDTGQYTPVEANITTIDYSTYDVIINTSFELLEDPEHWLDNVQHQKGTLIIIQSNNYIKCDENKNCSDSCEDLLNSLKFNNVLYSGTMTFPDYERYMVVGRI